ncbi:VirK/YbjX family protein [Paramixta manurensis]
MLKKWRQQNSAWQTMVRGYNVIKYGARMAAMPPFTLFSYSVKCHHYRSARLLRSVGNLPSFSERPFNKYLSRQWSGKKKLRAANAMLDFVEHSFSDEGILALYAPQGEGILLATIPLKSEGVARLKLMRSRFPREGDLGLYLFDDSDELVYALTFSIGENNRLYLGGLQGPKPEHGAERVKLMTKQLYGLRPKNLLISMVYGLAQHFAVTQINGVSDKAHIKSHHLKSSYESFWLECGAIASQQGWFRFPDEEPIRDIETVKSQHRSEFRKREALRAETLLAVSRTLCLYDGACPLVPGVSWQQSLPH